MVGFQSGFSLIPTPRRTFLPHYHYFPRILNFPFPIIRSLSCLGDVFSAIVTEKNYIPYRNAKLTLLLQEVLRMDSKLLLIANVAADDEGSKEEAATLTFAARCRGDHSLGHADLSSSLTNPF